MQSNYMTILKKTARLLVLAIVTLSLTGCQTFWAQKPDRSDEPAEGPLQVNVHTEYYTYHTQERVGQTVHRDSSGAQVGTSDVYQDTVRDGEDTTSQLQRDGLQVDEADFYEFAGYQEVADDIEGKRDRAVMINRISTGVFVGGLLTTVAAYALITGEDSGSLRYGVSVGGILLALGGYYGAAFSSSTLEPSTRFTNNEQAEEAASQYNREAGHSEPGLYQTQSTR